MNTIEPLPRKLSALAVWSFVLGLLALVLCLAGLSLCCLRPVEFILALLGLVLCLVAQGFALPGVVCGHLGLSRVRKSGGRLTGKGLGIMGLATSYCSFTMLLVVAVLVTVTYSQMVHNTRSGRQPTRFRGHLPAPESLDETGRKDACIINLKQIQGAKEMWALEHKKTALDTPADADLFGPDKYLAERPVCPAGGAYSLNTLTNPPTCSVLGHAY